MDPINLHKEITEKWLLMLAGMLSVILGILLIANPQPGALTVVWLIGLYSLIFGGVMTWSHNRDAYDFMPFFSVSS